MSEKTASFLEVQDTRPRCTWDRGKRWQGVQWQSVYPLRLNSIWTSQIQMATGGHQAGIDICYHRGMEKQRQLQLPIAILRQKDNDLFFFE